MGRREVVPLSVLERRVHAHLDGKHSHTSIKDTLTALATLTMLDAEAEPSVRRPGRGTRWWGAGRGPTFHQPVGRGR